MNDTTQKATIPLSFEAIGTHWQIDLYENVADIEKKIHDRIDVFDKNYSRFRKDSLVYEMSQRAGEYTLQDDAKRMLDMYELLYKVTGGAFTPLIGDTLASAGYDAEYSLVPKSVTKPLSWEESIDYSFPKLTIKKPTMLDFGGLGKGYLIDIIATLLIENGCNEFTIDAGGDMYAHNHDIVVGLEHPKNNKQVVGTVTVHNQSICGSSGSRRAWADYHHIINPNTLTSPRHILSSWTVAKTTLVADAMATCLFLVDSATLKAHFDFEFVTVADDLQITKSEKWAGELFT